MERRPLAEDTPFEIEQIQIEMWRNMTTTRKLELVFGVSQSVDQAARAGVRLRHPGATEREAFLRLAILRLGYASAVEAFPDAAGLAP
jgi:hypothetical protein